MFDIGFAELVKRFGQHLRRNTGASDINEFGIRK